MVYFLIRNYKVKNFLIKTIEEENYLYNILPPYPVLLFSFKPLRYESWLTPYECYVTNEEIEDAFGESISDYKIKHAFIKDEEIYCTFLIKAPTNIEYIEQTFIVEPIKTEEDDKN
jgi:hypothetical protein